jgi:predicted permease
VRFGQRGERARRLTRGNLRLGQLQAELDRLTPHLGPSRAIGDRSWGIKARGLMAYWRGRAAPGLALPFTSGLLILLLACANVAHLMLARSLDRTREWGLRAALGAGHSGLKGPLLMEAALLVAGGAILSLPLLRGLQVWGALPSQQLQGPVLIPMAAALVVALLVTSLLPLRWASRLDLNEALREGGAASASRGSNRLRGALAVLQLALAFALLVGAGLSLRALERLQGLDPGYDLKHLQVAILRLDMRPGEDFMVRSAAFQRHVRQAMAQVPGVDGVALSNTRPLVDQGHEGNVWPEGQGALHVGQHAISSEYFQTLKIPLLSGRNLEEGERDSCLVSASLARRCWGEASPLGRQIRMDSAEARPLNVVGVVGEARMSRMAREAVPAIYTSLARAGSAYLTVYIRSAASTAALRQSVQEAARQSDSGVRLLKFQSLESLAAREQEGPRTLRRQTLGAGLLAAFLAGIGLAGTLAQAAARQKREWGIRSALGASPLSLFNLVFRRVFSLLAVGLALGTVLAWALWRILQHQFQGVSPADPNLLAFAMLSLGFTCFLAGLGPALRAALVNPAEVLRSE